MNNTPQKMHIPASPDVAAIVADLADRMGHSQAWMVCELIDAAVADSENVMQRFAMRTTSNATRSLGGFTPQLATSDESLRLQTKLPEELAQKVERMADNINVSTVRMASILLHCGVLDNEWIIRVVTTRCFKKITRAILGEHESTTATVEISGIPANQFATA